MISPGVRILRHGAMITSGFNELLFSTIPWHDLTKVFSLAEAMSPFHRRINSRAGRLVPRALHPPQSNLQYFVAPTPPFPLPTPSPDIDCHYIIRKPEGDIDIVLQLPMNRKLEVGMLLCDNVFNTPQCALTVIEWMPQDLKFPSESILFSASWTQV